MIIITASELIDYQKLILTQISQHLLFDIKYDLLLKHLDEDIKAFLDTGNYPFTLEHKIFSDKQDVLDFIISNSPFIQHKHCETSNNSSLASQLQSMYQPNDNSQKQTSLQFNFDENNNNNTASVIKASPSPASETSPTPTYVPTLTTAYSTLHTYQQLTQTTHSNNQNNNEIVISLNNNKITPEIQTKIKQILVGQQTCQTGFAQENKLVNLFKNGKITIFNDEQIVDCYKDDETYKTDFIIETNKRKYKVSLKNSHKLTHLHGTTNIITYIDKLRLNDNSRLFEKYYPTEEDVNRLKELLAIKFNFHHKMAKSPKYYFQNQLLFKQLYSENVINEHLIKKYFPVEHNDLMFFFKTFYKEILKYAYLGENEEIDYMIFSKETTDNNKNILLLISKKDILNYINNLTVDDVEFTEKSFRLGNLIYFSTRGSGKASTLEKKRKIREAIKVKINTGITHLLKAFDNIQYIEY